MQYNSCKVFYIWWRLHNNFIVFQILNSKNNTIILLFFFFFHNVFEILTRILRFYIPLFDTGAIDIFNNNIVVLVSCLRTMIVFKIIKILLRICRFAFICLRRHHQGILILVLFLFFWRLGFLISVAECWQTAPFLSLVFFFYSIFVFTFIWLFNMIVFHFTRFHFVRFFQFFTKPSGFLNLFFITILFQFSSMIVST